MFINGLDDTVESMLVEQTGHTKLVILINWWKKQHGKEVLIQQVKLGECTR